MCSKFRTEVLRSAEYPAKGHVFTEDNGGGIGGEGELKGGVDGLEEVEFGGWAEGGIVWIWLGGIERRLVGKWWV